MITIKPDEKFCDYIDNVMITGFKQSEGYFIIQRDDDDATNFYIEVDDQGQSCYNGIKEIIIDDDKIIFELNPEGRENLNTEAIQIVDKIKGNETYDGIVREIEFIRMCLKNFKAQH